MAKHNEIGKKGEEMALSYLLDKGWQIVATNWRYSRAEIDLVGKVHNGFVFVEVKTRSGASYGPPEVFVDSKKEQFLFEAANAFMEFKGYEGEIRFDIIAVYHQSKNHWKITHWEDAFFPGLKQ